MEMRNELLAIMRIYDGVNLWWICASTFPAMGKNPRRHVYLFEPWLNVCWWLLGCVLSVTKMTGISRITDERQTEDCIFNYQNKYLETVLEGFGYQNILTSRVPFGRITTLRKTLFGIQHQKQRVDLEWKLPLNVFGPIHHSPLTTHHSFPLSIKDHISTWFYTAIPQQIGDSRMHPDGFMEFDGFAILW